MIGSWRMNDWLRSPGRRSALRALAGFWAGSPLLTGQLDPLRDHARVPALAEMMTAFDFEPVAYAKLPRSAYDYTAMGVESEFTLRRNREAFDWVRIVPRAFAGNEKISTATTILGTPMPYPILAAPTAAHLQLHPAAEPPAVQGLTAR